MPYRLAGDYYRGSIFSTIGHALGGIAKVGIGALTGGPIGAAKAAVNVATTGIKRETLAAGGDQSALTPQLKRSHAMALKRAATTQQIGSSPAGTVTEHITAPALNGGGGGGGDMFGGGRRHRRMNWANHRALARAERRIHSAVKHMSKYIRWVHPNKVGHAAPKFGSKSRPRAKRRLRVA